VLGPRRVRPGIAALNQSATVEYQPLGVVGVIGPWNYPVFTPWAPSSTRSRRERGYLQASELTPAVGEWLVRSFDEVAGRGAPEPVLQLLTGGGEPGPPWREPRRQDRLHRVGRDRAQGHGHRRGEPDPVIAECGGKDALIVDADADLNAAADAAAWGALSNAGQTCVGVERVYVADPVYETFLAKLADRSRGCARAATRARTTAR